MTLLSINKEYVAIKSNSEVLVADIEKGQLYSLNINSAAELNADKQDLLSENTVNDSSSDSILGVDLSPCCRWIALCSCSKEMSIWNIKDWKLHSKRVMARSAEKVKFAPSGNYVVVADKSGDAYLFSIENPDLEGKLILGHLSMLLDVLITKDEQYIITCDRDEKIRVSHFPNAYNIKTYCLGHKEFVSCLSFLPHDNQILISGSGDGHVILWSFVLGLQLQEINCGDIISKYKNERIVDGQDIATFVDHEIDNENHDNNCAIINICCCIATTASLIGVCVQDFKGILIFRVTGNVESLDCTITEIISLQEQPWDLCFSLDCTLWNFSSNSEKPLKATHLDSQGKIDHTQDVPKFSDKSKTFDIFNDYCKLLQYIRISQRKCILYKRKFDNLTDYAEKKKARLIKNI